MRHLSSLGLTLMILVMLAGCGQKGPLYLPGDEEAAETYDLGGEYDDEADENADEGDDSQDSSDDAETTSDDEG